MYTTCIVFYDLNLCVHPFEGPYEGINTNHKFALSHILWKQFSFHLIIHLYQEVNIDVQWLGWVDNTGEQGWRSVERDRLPPMCPGLDSRMCHRMWVEFVVGSLLCSERFFSKYSWPVFPSPQKTTFPNSNSGLGSDPTLIIIMTHISQLISIFEVRIIRSMIALDFISNKFIKWGINLIMSG